MTKVYDWTTSGSLIRFSLELEKREGWDSIPTIDRMYRWPEDNSSCVCVMPSCDFRRNSPVEMWKHVHATGHEPVEAVVTYLNLVGP